jgi:hypothetical protein
MLATSHQSLPATPASSKNGDGCADTVAQEVVISCETKTLALSIAGLKEGELKEDESIIQLQNQIVIAVCEIVANWRNVTGPIEDIDPQDDCGGSSSAVSHTLTLSHQYQKKPPSPPIIIGTTSPENIEIRHWERTASKECCRC